MEFLSEGDFKRLSNPGVVSLQMLSPHNSQSSRVTITKVTIQPGTTQPAHRHVTSEQVWVAMEGTGTLLLDGGATLGFKAGEVVRFADGDLHGLHNGGTTPFIYISVTAPPINFDYA